MASVTFCPLKNIHPRILKQTHKSKHNKHNIQNIPRKGGDIIVSWNHEFPICTLPYYGGSITP